MTETRAKEVLILYIRRYPGTEAQKALAFLTDCANGALPGDVLQAFSILLLSQLSIRGVSPHKYWAGRDDQLLFPYDGQGLLPDTVCEVRQLLSGCGMGSLSMAAVGALLRPGVRKYSRGQMLLMRSKLMMSGKSGDQELGMQGLKDLCDASCDRAVWGQHANPYAARWKVRVSEFLSQVSAGGLV